MFDACRKQTGANHCTEVAEKLVQIFGWRQTYCVEKLQRNVVHTSTLHKVQQNASSASSWLAVHSLQSQSDGGLLDPDDRVLDVADDREQIVANFEDDEAGSGVGGVTRHVTGGPHHHHHHLISGDRGDGASGGGSSVGSSSAGGNSPELFLPHPHHHTPFAQTDIEVTGEQMAAAGLNPLQVRRGSEPALNQLAPGPLPPPSANSPAADPTKRWSAAPLMDDDPAPTSAVARKAQHRKEGSRQRRSSENGHLSPTWGEEEEGGETGRNGSAFSRFVRDSNRLSMQFLGEGAVNGVRWVEAAERAAHEHGASPGAPSAPRKEPLGANSSSPVLPQHARVPESDVDDDAAVDVLEYVVLRNEEGPLGIHVVPDYDRLGQDRGLLVQGIEPGGRIDQDGRLAFCDRIIEINGHNLINMPFQTVQEIFRDSLRSPELQLRVVKHRAAQSRRPPAPVFPRTQPTQQGHRGHSEERDNVAMVEGEEKVPSVHTKVATVSPTKKVPSVHPASRNANILLTANTRKIGKKLEIELVKGPHGLGFSITTRDNPAGGNCPIYIKNILPKGAAVEDGRLRPGDRLLEVNNVAMTGKTQSEAVSILRNAPAGGKVSLVVSRQEKGDESPRLPREITPAVNETVAEDILHNQPRQSEPPEKANDDGLIFPWKHREILTFDIPVHDTEKAGLGVSVKGKTTAGSNGTIDLGIFVKSVIHGGAASRDGRLRTNDQLVDINGASLLATSNSDAMETLRRGMHQEGPKPGVITLTVARRVSSTPGSHNTSPHSLDGTTSGRNSANSLLSSSSGTETFGMRLDGEGPTPENSCASETSDNTVIFLPKANGEVPRPPDYVRPPDRRMINPLDPLATRNPVIDRLTGQQQSALRNESYYRATNDSWNSSLMVSGNAGDKYGSPTINISARETVLIEEEYTPHQIIAPHPRRPDKIPMPQMDRNQQLPDGRPGHPGHPQSPQDPSSPRNPAVDITYASQTSLEEVDAAGFSRDAFGRQSMSEKRHAALDAKNTDTYQRNKKLRDERERQRQMQSEHHHMIDRRREEHMMNGHAELNDAVRYREAVPGAMYRATSAESIISMTRSQAGSEMDGRKTELGPGLGMKKSSSLESLQTMVQEIQMQDDGEVAYTYRGSQGPVKVIRGRGCNESFRAAVDRSYEAPLAELRARMETLSEEDVEINVGAGTFGRGTRQQSSLNSALDNKYGKKDAKKKAGLFRGIGSMFRFGKHRKGVENPLAGGRLTEEEPEGVDVQERERERLAARQAAQEEQQRIHEQYQLLMQRQRQTENQQMIGAPPPQHVQSDQHQQQGHPQQGHPQPGSMQHHMLQQQQQQMQQQQQQHQMQQQQQGRMETGGPQSQQSRTERIQQLRAQHQRRHAERRGQYPLDEREERYEQRLEQPPPSQPHGAPPQPAPQQQQKQQQVVPPPAQPDVVHHHHRTASYDLYGEMARPGSRSAIADPNRYSHYVNYEEIQHHLSKRTEQLSEQQIIQMRQQVQQQRGKVEEESRRQQHYHSQRRDPREVTQQRPVSNYFEYESVQAGMRAGQHPLMLSPHHPPQLKQHFVRDGNANSLPRKGHERNDAAVHKPPGNFGNPPSQRQYPPPPPIVNNNNNINTKSGNYGSSRGGGPPHIHETYVPVHTRASGRSNGSAFPPKMATQSGSKV